MPVLGLAMVLSCAFPSGCPAGFTAVAAGFLCGGLVSAFAAPVAKAATASKGRMLRMRVYTPGEGGETTRIPGRPRLEKRSAGACRRRLSENGAYAPGKPASRAALAAAC